MLTPAPLSSLKRFISLCRRDSKNTLLLFRGQDCFKPLLPKVARFDPSLNSTEREKTMLAELRRVGGAFLPTPEEDDWDLLARAQHFRLATRLLDWTTNPLVALWFACRGLDASKPGFVYMFAPESADVLEKGRDKTPFDTGRTLVYRPNLRNPRILAQAGWFTLHKYSVSSRRFVPLEKNPSIKRNVISWVIDGSIKSSIVDQLDQLGVNHLSMFPDIEGVCRHLNWIHDIRDKE